MLLLATSTRYGWLASPASALRAGGRRAARRTLMSEAPYGVGLSQSDMMERDLLILVDGDDRVTGAMSKREAHTFGDETPRGWLHRAFSCFLFDARGRMLLTKRADSKITFPGVWTNACCSHPLHGRVPDEVDTAPVASDAFAMPGIKHAARRKLEHELGIDPAQLPHADFRFLTRFHYWAADTLTYGARAPWGEHEVDHVLFVQGDVDLAPNADEVSDARFLTADELRAMLNEDGLKWSPWFVGIMERGGWEWWDNLGEAMRVGSKYADDRIVYFDPPAEHVAAYNLPSHGRSTGVRMLEAKPA